MTTPKYRFFLDYDEEHDAINVFAAATNYGLYGDDEFLYTGAADELAEEPKVNAAPLEGFGATFPKDNSGVSYGGACREALGPEIPEAVARKLHPRLFDRLDDTVEAA